MTDIILKRCSRIYRSINRAKAGRANFTALLAGIPYSFLMQASTNGFKSGNLSIGEIFSNRNTEEIFHVLREAIAQITHYEKNQITAETSFEELFPPEKRSRQIRELQNMTGYKILFLKPKRSLSNLSAILLITSTGFLFVNGLYGISGIILSVVLFFISHRTGTEFIYETIGQAAEKISIDRIIYSKD